MPAHRGPALCTLFWGDKFTSGCLTWIDFLCSGLRLVGCQSMVGEWPKGRLPWILLLSQLSLTEMAKVETFTKPRSWCSLEQMVLPAGHLPLWLPSFLGSSSLLSFLIFFLDLFSTMCTSCLFPLTSFGGQIDCTLWTSGFFLLLYLLLTCLSIHTCFFSLPSFWFCRSCLSVKHQPPGIVVHAYNPRTLDVEIGGLLWVWGRISYTISTRPVRCWDTGLSDPVSKQ